MYGIAVLSTGAHGCRNAGLSTLCRRSLVGGRAREHDQFITFIASSPEAGVVIRGSGGCWKVRWSAAGVGKRGGARVVYFIAQDGVVWLLIVYKKAKFDKLPTSFLAKLKQGVEDAL